MLIYSESQNPWKKIINMDSNLKIYRNALHPPVFSAVSISSFYSLLWKKPSMRSGFSSYPFLCVCFTLSFPLNLTSLSPIFSPGLPLSPLLAIIWKYMRSIYWTAFPPINIKSHEWNHLFTFLSKRTQLSYLCSWRSLTFRSLSAPFIRGPLEREKYPCWEV